MIKTDKEIFIDIYLLKKFPDVTMGKEIELTKKSDIYSLGVLFWELTSCTPPFDLETKNNSEYALIPAICGGKRENPIPYTNSKFVELYQSG